MTHHIQLVVAQLTATSGTGLRDILLGIIGTFTIVVLAWHSLAALAAEQYGKLITMVLAAIPVVGFAYFPDATVLLLQNFWTAIWS